MYSMESVMRALRKFIPVMVLAGLLLLMSGDHAAGQKSAGQKGKTQAGASKIADGSLRRSQAEVEALVEKEGRTPPRWFNVTPLNYPKSLDLSWPEQAPPPWNNQKNVGQYVWDIINPNPSRWPEGVRLMHHLLQLHAKDPAKRERVMLTLGRMYHNLLEAYARAAFWWKKAGADDPNEFGNTAIDLAECYWKLGNKQMALDLLNKFDEPRFNMIKLLADMGEIDKALEIVAGYSKDDDTPDATFLAAGDACRVAGRLDDAITYYQKVLATKNSANPGRLKRNHDRAQASLEAIRLFDRSDVGKVADGKYNASSVGYEGQVAVEVVVKNRRIESVKVVQHKEKQFYSALSDTPRKIIEKQSVKGVDATSSATITSEAIINATAKALASGAK
jgi:uncharacterized protein with FMN-binding domain